MLSVRSLLIESSASQPQVCCSLQQKQQRPRPSVLGIPFLLNDQEDVYAQKVISKERYYTHRQSDCIQILPPSSPQLYYAIDTKRQKRSCRQHEIESRKIEQELQNRRMQTTATCGSKSFIYSFTITRSAPKGELLPLKAKRRRATSNQLDVLNRVFQRTFFPSTQLRAELGRQLGMRPRTVQIWFQNKRQAIRTRERSITIATATSDSSRENSISPD